MRVAAVAVVLVAAAAMADVDAKFAKLRDDADPIPSLGSFVGKYVGDCPAAIVGGKECASNADQFRKSVTGKKYYMIVTEDSAAMLSMSEMNVREGTFTLNLTPFFAADNFALSHGAPSHTDAQGNPVMSFIRVPSKLPDAWNPGMMDRQVTAKALRVQIVFTPLGIWSLPKKGGGTIKGVKARFDGVLVQVGRTGETVGVWTSK